MDLIALLSLCACVLALLLAARVLFRPSDNPPAAWALAAFLVSTAAFVADQLAYQQDWFARFPHFYAVANPFIPALFPSLFLYVRGVTHPTARWRRAMLGHFALPAIAGLLEIPTFFLSAAEKTAAAHAQYERGLATPLEMLYLAILNLYGIVYVILAWRTVRLGRARLAESAEEGRAQSFRGLELFVSLFASLTVISAGLDFTPWRFGGSLAVAFAGVVGVFAAFWLLADHQPLLVGPAASLPRPAPAAPAPLVSAVSPPPAPPTPAAPPPSPEPAVDEAPSAVIAPVPPRTTLRPAEIERLRRRLDRLLLQERVHLDAELSLQALADRAETTRHKLSAAIREIYGLTFYQLIARLRVQEAARRLTGRAGASRTISDIAFSVGFNTLSAFNSAFKAEFGVTPSAYRDAPPSGAASDSPSLPSDAPDSSVRA